MLLQLREGLLFVVVLLVRARVLLENVRGQLFLVLDGSVGIVGRTKDLVRAAGVKGQRREIARQAHGDGVLPGGLVSVRLVEGRDEIR